jgi:hypothetical protein
MGFSCRISDRVDTARVVRKAGDCSAQLVHFEAWKFAGNTGERHPPFARWPCYSLAAVFLAGSARQTYRSFS